MQIRCPVVVVFVVGASWLLVWWSGFRLSPIHVRTDFPTGRRGGLCARRCVGANEGETKLHCHSSCVGVWAHGVARSVGWEVMGVGVGRCPRWRGGGVVLELGETDSFQVGPG